MASSCVRGDQPDLHELHLGRCLRPRKALCYAFATASKRFHQDAVHVAACVGGWSCACHVFDIWSRSRGDGRLEPFPS